MTVLSAPAAGGATVRCYRHGFGDCFLIAFGAGGGRPRYLLIDCGLFWSAPEESNRLREVAADVQSATGGRLQALVITHEHYDHLGGFYREDSLDLLRQLDIRELWLPWTERPEDRLAEELRRELRLELAFLRAAAAAPSLRFDSSLAGLLAFSKSTAQALLNVRRLFENERGEAVDGRRIRYFDPGQSFRFGRRGPRVYVLGPPRDRARLRLDDDPDHVYSRGAGGEGPHLAGDGGLIARPPSPFGEAGEPFERARDDRFLQSFYGLPREEDEAEFGVTSEPWRRIDELSPEELHRLALQYDRYVNNTSMVLAFELPESRRVLLFPGDAQVGNWLSWHDVEFSRRAAGVTAEDLLARTVFYKVGHHGSHNATASGRGLELMTSDELLAVIPTDEEWAWSVRSWTMPYMPLYLELLERCRGRVVQTVEGLPQEKPRLRDRNDEGELPYSDREWRRHRELSARHPVDETLFARRDALSFDVEVGED